MTTDNIALLLPLLSLLLGNSNNNSNSNSNCSSNSNIINNISKTLAKKLNNNSLRIQIHRLLNLAHKQLKPSIIKNLMLPVILINQQ